MSMKEDRALMDAYPELFEALENEFDVLWNSDCKCIKCDRCKRMHEVCRELSLRRDKLRKEKKS